MSTHPSQYKSAKGYAAVAEAYDRVLETWPVPFDARMVPTRFGKTHVITCGPQGAQPLLLLHGGGNCALMWRYCVAQLSHHFRIYAPDMVGDIGKSASDRTLTEVEHHVEWFTDLLGGLACRHPIYGAWVSLIVPGMGLAMRSWPVLGVVAAMYLTLRLLMRKEERELERLFGAEFLEYRGRTPAVFPLLHRMFRR